MPPFLSPLTDSDDEFWGRESPHATLEMPKVGSADETVLLRRHVGATPTDPDWAWSLLWFGCGVLFTGLLMLYLVMFRR